MDMKPIELQIAVPRTTEASAIQRELQQRPTTEQFMLNEEAMKHMRTQRQRSEQVDRSADGRIRDGEQGGQAGDESSGDGQHGEDEKQSAASIDTVPAVHPYKGKHIDFSV